MNAPDTVSDLSHQDADQTDSVRDGACGIISYINTLKQGESYNLTSEDYATPHVMACTPRKLLLPTDPWVITGYIWLMHSTYESRLGPKTRKRSLAWRPNTRHMALSALQLECVIQSSHDGCSAGDRKRFSV